MSAGFWVYVVECQDGSFYTGVAADVERRLAAHNRGRGARYTRGRGPVRLLASRGPFAHGDALRLELAIKRRPRADKLRALRDAP